ncbi:MAG TPA: 3-methyl-2-oxobutanoate hydroxymethyltransferase [Polyangiaceae bacterium]|jgi:3-methyl-2-oxobutanoate hydroxymethyltransferase|nr:3-methyl-2-oxobutanoate hydroxymethyltransferase [Polyangiaceae bacterium]
MYRSITQQAGEAKRKVTVLELRERKAAGPMITMTTAYDFTMAALFDEAGIDVILVGDSLGMVVQGHPNTLQVSLDEICYHGRAVSRALGHAHLVGDLPFMSFQTSPRQAMRNAGKLLKQGGFESVKLEGGRHFAEHVHRIVTAGIPVMGHVGLTPQSIHALGGFRVQGKTLDAAEQIVEDARALEQAGAYAILIEAMPPDMAALVTSAVSVPTIGIGAGRECDGQVLVSTDLLGLSRGHMPKFSKRFAELGDQAVDAARRYIDDVRARTFPDAAHEYARVTP